MVKYLGTHNSGTSYKLVWWQRLLTWPLQLVSQCQSRTIEQQLEDGINWFNLQITNYNDEWVFSHGLCIYDKKVDEILLEFTKYAVDGRPIYFTMSLDKNFILGQKIEKYKEYTETVNAFCKNHKNIIMLYSVIEGSNEFIYRNNVKIYSAEHYWTLSWAKTNSKTWIDKLPLPKRHANIYNKQYIEENTADYLMLDFYENITDLINIKKDPEMTQEERNILSNLNDNAITKTTINNYLTNYYNNNEIDNKFTLLLNSIQGIENKLSSLEQNIVDNSNKIIDLEKFVNINNKIPGGVSVLVSDVNSYYNGYDIKQLFITNTTHDFLTVTPNIDGLDILEIDNNGNVMYYDGLTTSYGTWLDYTVNTNKILCLGKQQNDKSTVYNINITGEGHDNIEDVNISETIKFNKIK